MTRLETFGERTVWPVGLQFVIFDEIDAAASRCSTSSAVASGVSPTLGLMMVPISGRP